MKRLTFILATIFAVGSYAQETDPNFAEKYLPNIGINAGCLSYNGDIGRKTGTNILSNVRFGYGFYLEKKIRHLVGISINGTMGNVAKTRLDTGGYWSFESKVTHIDLGFVFDMDNGFLINESSGFAPFVSLGIGFLQFDPHGDLTDANGSSYYHWNDGSLRDRPQHDTTVSTSIILSRDYTFESQLKDSLVTYKRNTITIPVKAGLKFNVSKNLKARIAAEYVFTFTDYLDNVATNNKMDKFLYTSFGLEYDWGISARTKQRKADRERYKDVDFAGLEKEDSDQDGVIDMKDKCQGTPPDVEVDSKGCAKDGDNDGVPDYLDIEPNTADGKPVNSQGVTITDEMLAAQQAKRDSIVVERKTYYSGDSDGKKPQTLAEKTKNIQETNKSIVTFRVPAKFKPVDRDKNGIISAKELTAAIDAYFEGEIDLNLDDLNELVDYFFEQ